MNGVEDYACQRHQAGTHCEARKRFGQEHSSPPDVEPALWPVFVAITLAIRWAAFQHIFNQLFAMCA
jgi:hypothetical protein